MSGRVEPRLKIKGVEYCNPSEFSRLVKMSLPTIFRRIDMGHLPHVTKNGKRYIPLEEGLSEWKKLEQKRNEDKRPGRPRIGKELAQPTLKPKKTSVKDHVDEVSKYEQALLDESSKKYEAQRDARLRKDFYASKLEELAYLQKSGKLVSVDEVRIEIHNSGNMIRNALESIPDRLSPVIASMSDENEIRKLLMVEIKEALRSLVDAGKWKPTS